MYNVHHFMSIVVQILPYSYYLILELVIIALKMKDVDREIKMLVIGTFVCLPELGSLFISQMKDNHSSF